MCISHKREKKLGMVANTFNLSTPEARVGGSLCLKLAWFTYQVPGKLELHSEADLKSPHPQKKKMDLLSTLQRNN